MKWPRQVSGTNVAATLEASYCAHICVPNTFILISTWTCSWNGNHSEATQVFIGSDGELVVCWFDCLFVCLFVCLRRCNHSQIGHQGGVLEEQDGPFNVSVAISWHLRQLLGVKSWGKYDSMAATALLATRTAILTKNASDEFWSALGALAVLWTLWNMSNMFFMDHLVRQCSKAVRPPL